MIHRYSLSTALLLLLFPLLGGCETLTARDPHPAHTGTYLDRVTSSPDPAFAYTLAQTHDLGELGTGYTLRLTSQRWRDESEVSHPLWTHDLQIVCPPGARSGTALLIVLGGRRTYETPGVIDDTLLRLAHATGSVCVLLPNVPNQPLAITDSDDPNAQVDRYEDDLIAQSWVRALETRDPDWIVQTAMVRAAIAAMDATQSFLGMHGTTPIQIEDFVVTGASKRGWTAWLTGAVDERIRAIIPIVIDTFNMPESIRHHWRSYGQWSPAIDAYTSRGLFHAFESSRGDVLRENTDPYLYRDRYTMPKFLLNSAGDQYFLPDSTRFYLDGLPGRTALRYMPNTDHDLDSEDDQQPEGHQSAMESLVGFYRAIEHNRKLPTMTWVQAIEIDLPEKRARGTHRQAHLNIRCDSAPKQVTLWQAYNPTERDFRQSTIGNSWIGSELIPTSDARAVGTVDLPDEGFLAYFIEARFAVPGLDEDVTFTTPVFILPDVLPYEYAPN